MELMILDWLQNLRTPVGAFPGRGEKTLETDSAVGSSDGVFKVISVRTLSDGYFGRHCRWNSFGICRIPDDRENGEISDIIYVK